VTRPGSVDPDPGRLLFAHEIRRDGRLVATLAARRDPAGVVVDSEVFPVTQPPEEPGLRRPFTFATIDQAHHFAEEVLVAFEYLNCSVS
jgi:hypothetical protein